MNVIDGNLYHGITMGGLLASKPMTCREDECLDQDDLKRFCDNILLASHRAVLLTFFQCTPWRSGRYPSDRFIINSTTGKMITIKPQDVIHDDVDGHWLFTTRTVDKGLSIRYVDSFDSLLYHLINSK